MSLLLDALKRAALEKKQRDGMMASESLEEQKPSENDDANQADKQRLSSLNKEPENYQPDLLADHSIENHISFSNLGDDQPVESNCVDDDNVVATIKSNDIDIPNSFDSTSMQLSVEDLPSTESDNVDLGVGSELSSGNEKNVLVDTAIVDSVPCFTEHENSAPDLDMQASAVEEVSVTPEQNTLTPEQHDDEIELDSSDIHLSMEEVTLWGEEPAEEIAEDDVHVEEEEASPALTPQQVEQQKQTIEKLILLRKEEAHKETVKSYGLYGLLLLSLLGLVFVYYWYKANHFSGQSIYEENRQFLSSIEAVPAGETSVEHNGDSSASLTANPLQAVSENAQENQGLVTPSFSDTNIDMDSTVDEEPQKIVEAITDVDASSVVEVVPAADRFLSTDSTRPESQESIDLAINNNVFEDSESYIRVGQTKPNPADKLTQTAYQYYQQGDLAKAKSAYDEILKASPEHRDALLGAAAIATRQSAYQDAFVYYQQLLNHYPQDVYAKAGLLSLSSENVRNPRWLSQISELLRQYPDVAHLHFLNANANAANGDWSSAQASYFDAWSREKENADYAYNLAISLDQLNQPSAALIYYQMALQLSSKVSSAIDKTALVKRINQLQGSHNE